MIFIDTREPERIAERLRKIGVTVERRKLEVGDYLIKHGSFEVIVERKDIRDFLSSIVDGRIFRQCHVLSSRYPLSFLMIVGKLSDVVEERNFSRQAVVGAIVSIAVKREAGQIVPLVFENEEDFCYALRSIDKKVEESELRIAPRIQKAEKPEIAMLTAIPGVGEKRAMALLKKFGSVYRIANASVAELMRVEGIGEKRARQIYRTFRRRFE